MSELNRLIEEMFHDQRERTHTVLLCRIEKYDHEKMTADLQPLTKEYYDTTGEGDYEYKELEVIKEASVACLRAGSRHLIRPPYKVGDTVLVACAERSIDNVIETGEISEQVGSRRHSLQDAIVIGGITIEPDPMPEEHGEDLLICKTGSDILTRIVLHDEDDRITIAKGQTGNFDAHVTIEPNNDIYIESKGDIYIQATGIVYINGGQVRIND